MTIFITTLCTRWCILIYSYIECDYGNSELVIQLGPKGLDKNIITSVKEVFWYKKYIMVINILVTLTMFYFILMIKNFMDLINYSVVY